MLNTIPSELLRLSMEEFESKLAQISWQKLTENPETQVFIIAGEHPLILKRIAKHHPEAKSATFVQYFYDITRESNIDQMKSDVLSMAAHDLRTSMSSIQGYTELLLKRAQKNELDNPQSKDFLAAILRQSHHLNCMINDLLDLTKIESQKVFELNTSRCEVNRVVSNAMTDFFTSREVKLTPYQSAVSVEIDLAKFNQALQNIFSNAQKYSDHASMIEVSISFDEASDMVGISVKDHGIGMTPVQQSQLFSRFYRANPNDGINGSGLGLCLVKEILELHSGGVEVNSIYGKGTQITLWLPSAKD